jgi:hypothetical protein
MNNSGEKFSFTWMLDRAKRLKDGKVGNIELRAYNTGHRAAPRSLRLRTLPAGPTRRPTAQGGRCLSPYVSAPNFV